MKDWAEKQEGKKEVTGKENFADQIKIDFIPSIDYRIMCRFLDVTTVGEIKNHPYQSNPLITLILMETLEKFMKTKGFNFVGELNFDQHGNSIPPEKNPWHVKGKETTFTTTGFLYFESESGNKQDNVVYFLYADLERGGSQITCYSNDTGKSKDLINNLEEYSKENNCLRGAKLKDVNMISASFSEVAIQPKYTWDNYYYPESIKELFDLEVLGFMENVEQYNKYGINKRGIILHGKPGTGKTTIGNVICNLVPEHTVIWITPEILTENNYKSMSSIKALYKLADFLSPCIIILEDLDLFSQDRDRGGDVMSLGALMNVLDGVNSIKNSITIGTTNRIESIEAALRNRPGRFDRIIEIPPLDGDLRDKMFKERLSDWKVNKNVWGYLVDNTEDWTGAEVQELVNSLHLKHISSKRTEKKIDKKWAEEIIDTMDKFGVGEASSNFGFGGKNS
jgi:SpoVK/Ycf46/Vps4 family AAA+-type ATPase